MLSSDLLIADLAYKTIINELFKPKLANYCFTRETYWINLPIRYIKLY